MAQVRDIDGKFLKGQSGNPATQWKPGQTGNRSGLSFASHCQYIVERSRLVKTLAEIATGAEPFERVGVNDRLSAIQLLLAYAYGKPRPTAEVPDDNQPIFVKRIIGVDVSKI
jgi:hypothetical protein